MLKLADMKRYFIDQIMEQGLAKSRSQAETLFVESLARNVVGVEIMDMCRYIAKEEGTK